MSKRIYILLIILTFSWTVYGETLTLDSCLQMARRNNPTMRKAQLDVQRAEEVKAQALTKYFPQIQGSAFGFHALHPLIEVGIDDIRNESVREVLSLLYSTLGAPLGLESTIGLFQYGYAVGVTALQPVFVGGKIVAGNQLAKVGVEAAKLQAEITEREQLEATEESYWMVYGLQLKQEIIDDAMLLMDTLYQSVDAAVAAGLALPSDLTQVSIRKDEIERKQVQLQSGLRLARRALALAIGWDNADSLELAEQTVEVEPILPNDTAAQTTEHQLLALQVRAAELERKMALADALPQLAVGANYSYSQWQANVLRDNWNNKTGNGALFVTLQVPITNWWETGHKLKEKRYALEQAQIDAEYIGSQLNLRTQQAYDQVVEAEALLRVQQRTAEHAQEAYNQALINYEAGRATIIELLKAQMDYTQAKVDLTDAQIGYRVKRQRYLDLVRERNS